MFHVLIIILITIGALGIATYSGVTLLQATQTSTDSQTNLRRFETVAWNLRNVGGAYSPTYNSYTSRMVRGTSASLYSWPRNEKFSNPYTANGILFHLCPYTSLSVAGSTNTINTPNAVNDYTNEYKYMGTSTTGEQIITKSSATQDSDAPSDTLFTMTMAAPGASVPPQCNAITTTNSILTASGGRVAAITTKQIVNEHIYSASKYMNLYVATSSSGDGTGRDSSNAMTLNQAMTIFYAIQPRVMIINLAAGTYTADGTTTFPASSGGLSAGNPLGSKLYLSGPNQATTTIDFSGSVTVDLPIDLQIQGVTFGNSSTTMYVRKGGSVTTSSATLNLQNLYIDDGTFMNPGTTIISVTNTIRVGPSGQLYFISNSSTVTSTSALTAIEVDGGKILLRASTTITVPNGGTGIKLVAGNYIAYSGVLTISASSGNLARGIWIFPGASAGIFDMTVNSNPTVAAIDNAGYLRNNGTRTFLVPNGAAAAIRMSNGAETFINLTIGSSSNASQRPTTGILDAGGSKIWGAATVYAITKCWDGSVTPHLFSDSAEGNGQVATPLGTSGPTDYRYLLLDNALGATTTCTR